MQHDALNTLLQYLASGAGAIGAVLMALKISQPRYAYYIWITGDILFIPYCIATDQWAVLVMNLVYLLINLAGIVRWRDGFGTQPQPTAYQSSIRDQVRRGQEA